MKKEFYVIELFKQYGGWSNKPYSYYKRRDGITPNLELAKIFHYLDGELLEVSK